MPWINTLPFLLLTTTEAKAAVARYAKGVGRNSQRDVARDKAELFEHWAPSA